MSTDMGSISQNIANVNTTGYKRTETMFKTMMSESKASPNSYVGGLNIFGVQAVQRNHIQAQGVIQPSTTWSDMAINGSGFFMVAPPVGTTAPTTVDMKDPNAVMYTRDGSWSRTVGDDIDPNLARSYFTTSGGNYLMGWMADSLGNIPDAPILEPVYTLGPKPIPNNGTAAVDNNSTLTPTSQTMPGRTTTMAQVLANIPRDSALGGFESTVSVLDGNGATQDLALTWTRTGAFTWDVAPNAAGSADNPYVTAFAGGPWSVTMDDTGAVTSPLVAQPLDITWDAAHGNSTVTDNVTLDTPPKRGAMQNISMQVFDDGYTEHTVTLRFERAGTNQWYLYPDPGSGATAGTAPTPMLLDFNTDGSLASIDGTPATAASPVAFSWDVTSGTPPVTTAQTATVNLDLQKLTQYASSGVYRNNVVTDGYGAGTLMQTSFTDTGELQGYYSNGRSRTLFKVPVANFVADDSLSPVSGNLFMRTKEAGDVTVSAIEDAPGESRYVTSSLEGSATEIEDEFTRMIMTQKAYSSNAQVFKTADEMTSTARDLKR